jgi:hypothetical protein
MAYEFQCAGSAFGADLDDLEDLASAQIVAAAAVAHGIECTTPAEFRDAYAARQDEDPGMIGVDVWHAFPDGSDSARFTLIYFPYVDGGVLFHAGSANTAGLMLWQHGFEPLDGATPAVDPAVLTKDYFAARRRPA